MQEYTDWINKYYPTPQSAYRQCAEATLEMLGVFPELTRIRGLASIREPGDLPPTKTNHWWLTSPTGDVIDPTSHQWPTEVLEYRPATPGREPTGKCPNCGDLCYDGDSLCTDKCSKEFLAYLNSPEGRDGF